MKPHPSHDSDYSHALSGRQHGHRAWFRLDFANWTVRKRVIAAFSLITLLVLVQAAVVLSGLRKISETAITVANDTLPGLSALAEIQRNAGEIQTNVLRNFLPSTADELKKRDETIGTLRDDNNRLLDQYARSIYATEDRVLFDDLLKQREAYAAARVRVLELLAAGKHDEALETNRTQLRPAFNAFQQGLDKLLAFNLSAGKQNGAQIVARSSFALKTTVVSAGLVLILSVVVATLIVVSLTRALARIAESLSQGSDQVAAASGQVAAASQTLAEGASEQAASLEETSSSLEEMSSMTRRNSDSANKANGLAREARQVADAGATDMQAMTAAMDAIKSSGDDIAKIVKTIDEIAFQTNILALNAAVEAARAGTAGAGFAVVADEVRALAQRSAQAAKETAEKIEGSILKTRQGVGISQKVEASLTQIVDKVRAVDQLITEVSTASNEQSQGVQQINVAITQMDKVVQGSAANAEETASAAEELNAQALSMRESVSELNRLVTGRGMPRKEREPAAVRVAPPMNPSRSIIRTRPQSQARSLQPVHNGARPPIAAEEMAELSFKDM